MSILLVAPLEALTDALLSDPERRVLLSLFSFRRRDGDVVWPSVESIAERACINDLTRVSKLTASLAEKGWLTKRKKGFTGGNEYTLMIPQRLILAEKEPSNLDLLTNFDSDAKLESNTKSNLDSDAKCNEQTIEQTNKKLNKKISSMKTFNQWLAELAITGEKPIPENDPVFDYAEEAKIPLDFVRLAWVEFKVRYGNEHKKYKDWRAVFRKAVRGNWMKIWWSDGDEYRLTTIGNQAMITLNNKREAA